MGKLIVRYKTSQTPVSGTISWNTDDLRGVMRQLLVNPATSTTTYDFRLVDDDSITAFEKKGCKGTLNIITPMGLWGIYTARIHGSSQDEEFKVSIRYQEETGGGV